MKFLAILTRSAAIVTVALLGLRSEPAPLTLGDIVVPPSLFSGPYMSLYPNAPSDPGNFVQYNPALDLLSIPGSQDALMRIRPDGVSPTEPQYLFNGTYSLYMNLASDGRSSGGIFSVFGSVPDLGIQQPSLLLAASVVGADIGQSTDFVMQTVYANPNFGAWGPYLFLQGSPLQYQSQGGGTIPYTDTAALLSQAWHAIGPVDYYDLFSLSANPLPEPATLALVGVALLGFFVARRRKS